MTLRKALATSNNQCFAQLAVHAVGAEPLLRAGNSGSVYLLIDGVAYGPVGRSTRLVKNVLLRPAAIESRFSQAAAGTVPAE